MSRIAAYKCDRCGEWAQKEKQYLSAIRDERNNFERAEAWRVEIAKKNIELEKFVAEVDKAFKSNANFMWGKGKWSVISKIKAARSALLDTVEDR